MRDYLNGDAYGPSLLASLSRKAKVKPGAEAVALSQVRVPAGSRLRLYFDDQTFGDETGNHTAFIRINDRTVWSHEVGSGKQDEDVDLPIPDSSDVTTIRVGVQVAKMETGHWYRRGWTTSASSTTTARESTQAAHLHQPGHERRTHPRQPRRRESPSPPDPPGRNLARRARQALRRTADARQHPAKAANGDRLHRAPRGLRRRLLVHAKVVEERDSADGGPGVWEGAEIGFPETQIRRQETGMQDAACLHTLSKLPVSAFRSPADSSLLRQAQ